MNTTELMNEATRRRLDDLDSGRVAAVSGDKVFDRVCGRVDINEIPTRPQVEDLSYAEILAARVAAADRGDFVTQTEVAQFFAENAA